MRAHDLYPTPAPLTWALLAAEPLPERLWEPAAGLGYMSRELSRAGHDVTATDLVDYGHGVPGGWDFFKLKAAPLGIDTLVTNPPFNRANDFVRHGLTLCNKVCILNRLAFLEGARRSDLIDQHLRRVYVFVERPPMMHRWAPDEAGVWREWQGKKSSSAMPFAWFIFDKALPHATPITLKRLSWRAHQTPPRVAPPNLMD